MYRSRRGSTAHPAGSSSSRHSTSRPSPYSVRGTGRDSVTSPMAMDTTKHLSPSIPKPSATILVTVNSPMTPDKSSLIGVTSYGRDFIMKGYQEFSETVLNLGRQRNLTTRNMVAMATTW